MDANLTTFLFSAGAVVLAEMGDKSQLLALAFAARYHWAKVLLGVFIATAFNHTLAVALGNFLTQIDGAQVWIQVIASLAFILFGLWTIRGDTLRGEQNRPSRFGAVVTVAIAFFFIEMGDKTQLATIALAAKFPDTPIGILFGTTTGMVIADAIGIIVGVVMAKNIPERTVKLVSAGAFVFFGLIGTYQVATEQLHLAGPALAALMIGLTAATVAAAWWIGRRNRPVDGAGPFAVDPGAVVPETIEP